MRAPIGFVYGNCVFGDGLGDGWAAFAVEVSAYQWLSVDGKRARLLSLLGAVEAIEADVQILRVGRRWEVERYSRELDFEAPTTNPSGAPTQAAVTSKNTSVACMIWGRARRRCSCS